MTIKLTPDTEALIRQLHAAWQGHREAAREAETAIRGATSPEAREAAVDAAERLLRSLQPRQGRVITPERKALRAEAEAMRAQGASYSRIAEALGVPRSTAQTWVRGIQKGQDT